MKLTFTIQINDAASCRQALSHVLRSFPLPQLSRQRHPLLQEIILAIAFNSRIGRSYHKDVLPWIMASQDQLGAIDQTLIDVVERCRIPDITAECTVQNIRDFNMEAALHRMFPLSTQTNKLIVRYSS
jgi:hypothetical protein